MISNRMAQKVMVPLVLIAVGQADAAGTHSHAAQEAHVHGIAELTIAIEGNEVEMMLVSPAANILGFEHKPKTPEQNARITSASETLGSYGSVISFTGAACSPVEQDVYMPFESEHVAHSDETDEHDHHDHDHEHHDADHHRKEHDHEEHDPHEDHHGHHDEHKDHDEHHKHHEDDDDHHEHDHKHEESHETHSEVNAVYRLSCKSVKALDAKVNIFDHFPAVEKLQVQWIKGSSQGATQLSNKQRSFEIR